MCALIGPYGAINNGLVGAIGSTEEESFVTPFVVNAF